MEPQQRQGWLGAAIAVVFTAAMFASLASCAVSRSAWLDMAGEWTPISGICGDVDYRFTRLADGRLRFEYWSPSEAAYVESPYRGAFRVIGDDRVEFEWGDRSRGTDKFQLVGNELRYWVQARSWSKAPSCVFVRRQQP
ncbi:MAG: hypothetical protein AB7Q23_00410 [Hyphomonadaceae bacterium]